jgi:uncharacterized protein YegL
MDEDVFVVARRLPVYLLVDCSGSMVGEPIAAMEIGIRALLGELRNDPQAMDTVWLSIIIFNSFADQIIPLTDINEFREPDLEAGGSTALGEAITLLAERIDEEVHKTSDDQKGDWKPLVFVFTDGDPTDDWEKPVDDFHVSGRASVIACGAGPEVDITKLKRLSKTVVQLHDTQPGTLSAFMKWVTASVTMTSRTLGTKEGSGPELAELPKNEGITIIE